MGQKHCRITVLLQESSKVVNFLLKVVLHADDFSGTIVETFHHNFIRNASPPPLQETVDTSSCDEEHEKEKETLW